MAFGKCFYPLIYNIIIIKFLYNTYQNQCHKVLYTYICIQQYVYALNFAVLELYGS